MINKFLVCYSIKDSRSLSDIKKIATDIEKVKNVDLYLRVYPELYWDGFYIPLQGENERLFAKDRKSLSRQEFYSKWKDRIMSVAYLYVKLDETKDNQELINDLLDYIENDSKVKSKEAYGKTYVSVAEELGDSKLDESCDSVIKPSSVFSFSNIFSSISVDYRDRSK